MTGAVCSFDCTAVVGCVDLSAEHHVQPDRPTHACTLHTAVCKSRCDKEIALTEHADVYIGNGSIAKNQQAMPGFNITSVQFHS